MMMQTIINEKSAQRNPAFKSFETCLPETLIKNNHKLFSAATWCTRETESFDAILLDAPCSAKDMYTMMTSIWQMDTSRIKNHCHGQWALLSSAFQGFLKKRFHDIRNLRIRNENDGTLSKLIKKFPNAKIILRKMKETFSIMLNHLKPDQQEIT